MARNTLTVTINGKQFVSKEAKTAEKSLIDLSKTGEKVNKILAAGFAAAAAGIVASVAAVTRAVSNTQQLADTIDKTSQKIGISREAFQEWDFILSQNGMNIEQLQTSIKTLAGAAEEASRGTVTYTRTFDALGVSIYDVSGTIKDQETLLFDTIKALSGVENTTLRTAYATDLFGRSATELAPLLNSGADSVEALRQKAHELGLVLSDETIDAGVQLHDTIDQLRRTFNAVIANAVTPFLKVLNELGQQMLNNSTSDSGLGRFITVLGNWGTWVINNMPKIAAVFKFVFDFISITASAASEVLSLAVGGLTDFLDKIGLMDIGKQAIEFIVSLGGETYEAVKKGFETGDWSDFWGVASDVLATGVKIGITLIGAAKAVGLAVTAMQAAFGFATSGLGTGLALGTLSVFLALKEAQTEGNWADFAANLTAGIAAGFIAAGLTKSPTVGVWVATIAINLDIGAGIKDKIKSVWDDLVGVFQGDDAETLYGAALEAGKEAGKNLADGLELGITEAGRIGREMAKDVIEQFNAEALIKSPSQKMRESGEYLLQGLEAGITDPTYVQQVQAAWQRMMAVLQSDTSISIDPTADIFQTGGNGTTEVTGGGGSGIEQFIMQFADIIKSMESFKAILDPITTILSGMMEVLQPAIDAILTPLVGILKMLGATIGKILLPVFDAVGRVTMKLAEGFVWFHNSIIKPVGNFFVEAFRQMGNGIIDLVNGIIQGINFILGWAGVNISTISRIGANEGNIQDITLNSLYQGTSSFSGSAPGSSTSVSSLNITVVQNFDGPVIGEGGLESVGGYMVRAIEAYAGAGGNVEIISA